jgi:hypothetical protein
MRKELKSIIFISFFILLPYEALYAENTITVWL